MASLRRLLQKDIAHFRSFLPNHSVLSALDGASQHDVDPFNTDWMGRFRGKADTVLRPRTTAQVSQILRYCNDARIPVVPQGGNTGLVGGSVPINHELVLSLSSMNSVRSFDPVSGVLVADAGCVLQALTDHIAPHNHIMPIDLGAKGSCQIGGNVSTNAGGLRLLRYGSLHGTVLGLGVVLPDGTILDQLSTLRKDNTGYDLKQLFIGAEGTLGVVTAVSILTPPAPKASNNVILALPSFDNVLPLFQTVKRHLSEILSAFEYIDRTAYNLAVKHGQGRALSDEDVQGAECFVLIETSGGRREHDEEVRIYLSAPTLITLRQTLAQPSSPQASNSQPPAADPDEEEDEVDDVEGRISLAQALLESRIPDLPPAGTTRPQEPILITPTQTSPVDRSAPSSPITQRGSLGRAEQRRSRRRWSIMISPPSFTSLSSTPVPESSRDAPQTAPASDSPGRFSRSQSFRSHRSHPQQQQRPARSATEPVPHETNPAASVPDLVASAIPAASRSRFIPQFLSNAFNGRRSDERSVTQTGSLSELEGSKWVNTIHQNPAPKLEYVKLPGTKGALMIKAVETPKKSFLAILCGDNGEKVELFAGTYRTALGLSRTFILPDSPRSLELQLQGDDLVEVFLVFAQNIFGLEPATVRVREVRIERAERRAARRRARERAGELSTMDSIQPIEEETSVSVSIGVSAPSSSDSTNRTEGEDERSESPTLVASEHPRSQHDRPSSPAEAPTPTNLGEDFVILGTAQAGPYTTFQQLGFAPKFPLASIADEYIIPPTYASFVSHKEKHEQEPVSNGSEPQSQFSPPGLPVPPPLIPSRWFYRDPKNVVHGPWKASLMHSWYKDGLLPPDLPVRREEETEFILLRELRSQCVDPTQPFKPAGPAPPSSPPVVSPSSSVQNPDLMIRPGRPLLSPISLLSQPRHFGPPALFFSSRGGHSTSIVDARGRSVLKGKLFWSNDDAESRGSPTPVFRLGDVKRLEAFDVDERSLLVAMRQGGLEVVDMGDALLKPADESRTMLPYYHSPPASTSRRAPFIWRMGTPIAVGQQNGQQNGCGGFNKTRRKQT